MIENYSEYEKMYRAERKLWWYQTLHSLVLKTLSAHFSDKNIRIIDGACGTGGLMEILKENFYPDVSGFDISAHALKFSKERGLDSFYGDLNKVCEYFPASSIDAFISNDSLYFLTEDEKRSFAENMLHLLKPGGILIMNLPSLKAFKGTHDISVGIIGSRSSKKDIPRLFNPAKYEIIEMRYWPFLLSPLIYALRLMQRLKLKFKPGTQYSSDVEIPPAFINNFLSMLCKAENKIISHAPWGSSLYVVLRKKM
jgi:SAM-dependent methyltransferase